jgi:hypothetical protein
MGVNATFMPRNPGLYRFQDNGAILAYSGKRCVYRGDTFVPADKTRNGKEYRRSRIRFPGTLHYASVMPSDVVMD